MSDSVLRTRLGVRNQTLTAALRSLLAQGCAERRDRDGWTTERGLQD